MFLKSFIEKITHFLSKRKRSKKMKKDFPFLSRVLKRHEQNKPVSDFARKLFENETAESINKRFAEVKRKINIHK